MDAVRVILNILHAIMLLKQMHVLSVVCLKVVTLDGSAALGNVQDRCNSRGPLSKLEQTPPQRKIRVTSTISS